MTNAKNLKSGFGFFLTFLLLTKFKIVNLVYELNNLLSVLAQIFVGFLLVKVDYEILRINQQGLCDTFNIFELISPFDFIVFCIGQNHLLTCNHKLSFFIEHIEVWGLHLHPTWEKNFFYTKQNNCKLRFDCSTYRFNRANGWTPCQISYRGSRLPVSSQISQRSRKCD